MSEDIEMQEFNIALMEHVDNDIERKRRQKDPLYRAVEDGVVAGDEFRYYSAHIQIVGIVFRDLAKKRGCSPHALDPEEVSKAAARISASMLDMKVYEFSEMMENIRERLSPYEKEHIMMSLRRN